MIIWKPDTLGPKPYKDKNQIINDSFQFEKKKSLKMCLISRFQADTPACEHMQTTCLQMEKTQAGKQRLWEQTGLESWESALPPQEVWREARATTERPPLQACRFLRVPVRSFQLSRNLCRDPSLAAAPAWRLWGVRASVSHMGKRQVSANPLLSDVFF